MMQITKCFLFSLFLAFLSCSGPRLPETWFTVEVPSGGNTYLRTLDSLGYSVGEPLDFEGKNSKTFALNLSYQTEIRLESTLMDDPLRFFVTPGDSLAITIKPDTLPDSFHAEVAGSQAEFQSYLLNKDKEFFQLRSDLWQVIPSELDSVLTEYKSRMDQKRDSMNLDPLLARYDSLTDWSRVLSLELAKIMAIQKLDTAKIQPVLNKLSTFDYGLKKISDFNNLVYDLQSFYLNINLWLNPEFTEQELLAGTVGKLQGIPVDPFILKWMKAFMLGEVAEYGIDGDLGKFYKQFIASPDSPPVLVSALKERAEPWDKVKAGTVASDFTAITPDGDTVKLSQYFGKYLYLDIWAGWCKPCISEFPHSVVTMLDPRFKDFEFLFINMDPDQESWKTGMRRFQIPEGIQLYLPGEWNNELFSKYNRTAIPRYIIIDPHGKIVDAHAPRPSQRDKIIAAVSGTVL